MRSQDDPAARKNNRTGWGHMHTAHRRQAATSHADEISTVRKLLISGRVPPSLYYVVPSAEEQICIFFFQECEIWYVQAALIHARRHSFVRCFVKTTAHGHARGHSLTAATTQHTRKKDGICIMSVRQDWTMTFGECRRVCLLLSFCAGFNHAR